MGQEDRLKRQIDQLAKALANLLAKLIGQAGQVSPQEAVEQVNAKLKDELKLSLDELSSLPDDDLINTLTIRYRVTNTHLNLLADVVYASAKLQPDTFKTKELSAKALILYKHLTATEKTYSLDWDIKIAELGKIV